MAVCKRGEVISNAVGDAITRSEYPSGKQFGAAGQALPTQPLLEFSLQ